MGWYVLGIVIVSLLLVVALAIFLPRVLFAPFSVRVLSSATGNESSVSRIPAEAGVSSLAIM